MSISTPLLMDTFMRQIFVKVRLIKWNFNDVFKTLSKQWEWVIEKTNCPSNPAVPSSTAKPLTAVTTTKSKTITQPLTQGTTTKSKSTKQPWQIVTRASTKYTTQPSTAATTTQPKSTASPSNKRTSQSYDKTTLKRTTQKEPVYVNIKSVWYRGF